MEKTLEQILEEYINAISYGSTDSSWIMPLKTRNSNTITAVEWNDVILKVSMLSATKGANVEIITALTTQIKELKKEIDDLKEQLKNIQIDLLKDVVTVETEEGSNG